MPRVSVLMPMKDCARYVRAAVDSVLGQEFRDLELVVVDGGSTDGSRAVVERVSDPRVRLLDGPGRGIAAAWNAALEASRGEIVLACDADDLFEPGRCARQVAFLDAHPEFGACCGGFTAIDPSGRPVMGTWSRDPSAEEITAELLAGRTRTHLGTFAVRREALREVGGKREYFESAEDIDLQLRLAEVCRVWYEPRSAYRYRLHASSLTHSQPSSRKRFFEQYARDLRAQRAAGGPDDLQRGQPRPPPPGDDPADPSGRHIQGMLLGEAWRTHALGGRWAAIRLGLRALAWEPGNGDAWRSIAALILKRRATPEPPR